MPQGPGGVIFCTDRSVNRGPIFPEPANKRAVTFIDGQNLFHCALECFDYHYPNYDVLRLSHAVCRENGSALSEARFYTGFPDSADDPFWNAIVSEKKFGIIFD